MRKPGLPSLLLASLAALAGCDSNHRNVPFVPVPATEDESILHIYRPQEMANVMYSPDLLIDGEIRTAVKAGNKYMFRIAPGKHAIELSLNSGFSGQTSFELTAVAGSAYYLRVDTSLELQQDTAGYTPYARSFDLAPVDASMAIEQITQCCSREQGNTAIEERADRSGVKDASAGEGSPSQGFSTDRTSNPFNH